MDWFAEQVSSLWSSPASAGEPLVPDSGHEDLQKMGSLSKQQLLLFFSKGREELQSEAFRRRLKDAHFLKQDLEDVITSAQEQIFEQQGIEGKFGVQFLGKINTVFKDDDEVMSAFLSFVTLEEDALAEAELSPESYEQQKRLLELAKGHTAELMEKLNDLSPEDRKSFLADQMQKLEEIRQKLQSSAQASGNQMTVAEKLNLLENARGS